MRSAVLVVLAGVLALAAPAQAHHTPVPGVVALVGSLQSELGCPGDWQPECVQTRLQPVAGSPGVFRGTFDVPAGAFEYKVALNNSWDENYGAGGSPGGANIALDAPGGELTFTYDHATHVIRDSTPEVLGRRKAAHWLRRGLLAWEAPDGRHVPAAHGARGRARGAGRRDRRRRLVPAHPRRHPGARRLPAPRGVRHLRALRGGPARGARAAHRPADRRRLRRRGRARRCDRRADPRRPRRPVRGSGARPARPDVARTHAAARRVGADGQGRRARARRAQARDGPRARRRVADRGPAVVAERGVRLRGDGLRGGRGRHQRGDRPVFARPHAQLAPLAARGPRRPRAGAARLGPPAQAGARPARGLDDLRAPRARLLDHRRDGPGPRSRHVPRVHARGQRRHAPPAPARRQRHELAAPAADQRHRDDRGGPREAAGAAVRPRLLPARLRAAAGVHRPDP